MPVASTWLSMSFSAAYISEEVFNLGPGRDVDDTSKAPRFVKCAALLVFKQTSFATETLA